LEGSDFVISPQSSYARCIPRLQGSVNFNINLGGTIADPFEFYLGGGDFEDAQWNHFLGQVGSLLQAAVTGISNWDQSYD
jgi:hypothetical protein